MANQMFSNILIKTIKHLRNLHELIGYHVFLMFYNEFVQNVIRLSFLKSSSSALCQNSMKLDLFFSKKMLNSRLKLFCLSEMSRFRFVMNTLHNQSQLPAYDSSHINFLYSIHDRSDKKEQII